MIDIDPFNFSIGFVLQSWVLEYNPDLRVPSWDLLIPFMCFCLFQEKSSPYSPGWPYIHDPPSTFPLLRLQMYDTRPNSYSLLYGFEFCWYVVCVCTSLCRGVQVSGGACEHACAWMRRPEGSKYLFFIDLHIYFWRQGFSSNLKLMN